MAEPKVTTSTRSWDDEIALARRTEQVYIGEPGREGVPRLLANKPPRYEFSGRTFVEGPPYQQ